VGTSNVLATFFFDISSCRLHRSPARFSLVLELGQLEQGLTIDSKRASTILLSSTLRACVAGFTLAERWQNRQRMRANDPSSSSTSRLQVRGKQRGEGDNESQSRTYHRHVGLGRYAVDHHPGLPNKGLGPLNHGLAGLSRRFVAFRHWRCIAMQFAPRRNIIVPAGQTAE
jgi:hypothetical protein